MATPLSLPPLRRAVALSHREEPLRPEMTLPKALLVWLMLLGVAMLNGTVRQLGYAPIVGEPWAHRISCFTAIAALVAVIALVSRRWSFSSLPRAWSIGTLWLFLTVAFEFGMGRSRGLGWDVLLADYEIWNGQLWPLVLLSVLLAPPALFVWRAAPVSNDVRSSPTRSRK